mgnify:CR=1 FL=1
MVSPSRLRLNELLVQASVKFHLSSEVLAGQSLQLTSLKELALELEVLINANDEKLLKVPLAFDEHTVTGPLGGDCFDFNKFPSNRAIRASTMSPVAAKAELDLGVDLSELAPDL